MLEFLFVGFEDNLGPSDTDEGEENEGSEEDDVSLVGPESDEDDNFGGDQGDDEL
jgi:hypothetical protein